jgi:hypothetical protein
LPFKSGSSEGFGGVVGVIMASKGPYPHLIKVDLSGIMYAEDRFIMTDQSLTKGLFITNESASMGILQNTAYRHGHLGAQNTMGHRSNPNQILGVVR